MKIISRMRRLSGRTIAALVAAAGLVGGAAAVAPHLVGHTHVRQVDFSTVNDGSQGGGDQQGQSDPPSLPDGPELQPPDYEDPNLDPGVNPGKDPGPGSLDWPTWDPGPPIPLPGPSQHPLPDLN